MTPGRKEASWKVVSWGEEAVMEEKVHGLIKVFCDTCVGPFTCLGDSAKLWCWDQRWAWLVNKDLVLSQRRGVPAIGGGGYCMPLPRHTCFGRLPKIIELPRTIQTLPSMHAHNLDTGCVLMLRKHLVGSVSARRLARCRDAVC